MPTASAGNIKYLPEITINPSGNIIQVSNSINLLSWLPWLYAIGIALVFIYHSLALLKILFLKKSITHKEDNICFVNKNIPPFSFSQSIYLPEKLRSSGDRFTIIQHEQAHIQHKHSWDIFIMSAIAIFQWYNPFVWVLLKNLKEIHEYQADETTVRNGVLLEQYCRQIVNQSFASPVNVLVNNFNKSLTLKRLAMLTKEKVSRWGKLRFAILVPTAVFAFLAILMIQCENRESGIVSNSDLGVPPPPPPPPPPAEAAQMKVGLDGNPVYVTVDTSASFNNGDINDFRNYIQQHIKYPESAHKNKIEGKVIAQFVVNAKGKVEMVSILRGVSPELDQEVSRVLLNSPDWKPALYSGKNVNQIFVLPVMFKL
jgi:TonB family protein